jgi:hypothetical protein
MCQPRAGRDGEAPLARAGWQRVEGFSAGDDERLLRIASGNPVQRQVEEGPVGHGVRRRGLSDDRDRGARRFERRPLRQAA